MFINVAGKNELYLLPYSESEYKEVSHIQPHTAPSCRDSVRARRFEHWQHWQHPWRSLQCESYVHCRKIPDAQSP